MVEVDRCDQNTSNYCISMRRKKWWWALFALIPDMVMPNYWLLHGENKKEDSTLDLLAFRREIDQIYLKNICNLYIALKDHAAECFRHIVVLASTCDWIESIVTKVIQALNTNAKFARRTIERGEKNVTVDSTAIALKNSMALIKSIFAFLSLGV